MAGLTGYIQSIEDSFLNQRAITSVTIKDGEVAAQPLTGIIGATGIIPVGVAGVSGSPIFRVAKRDNHPTIAGYQTLNANQRGVLLNHSATAQTSQRTLIEEFATIVGDLDGVDVNGSDTNWVVSAKRDGTTTEVCVIEIEFWRRAASGVRTLLATAETTALNTSFATKSGTVNFTQSFGTGDVLEQGYFTKNKGVPA